MLGLIAELLSQPVAPAMWFDFEQKLVAVLRDTRHEIIGDERRIPLHPGAFERLDRWVDVSGFRDDPTGSLFR